MDIAAVISLQAIHHDKKAYDIKAHNYTKDELIFKALNAFLCKKSFGRYICAL